MSLPDSAEYAPLIDDRIMQSPWLYFDVVLWLKSFAAGVVITMALCVAGVALLEPLSVPDTGFSLALGMALGTASALLSGMVSFICPPRWRVVFYCVWTGVASCLGGGFCLLVCEALETAG